MTLDDKIARLEMLSEQVGIHLQELSHHSREAGESRSRLYKMLEELAELKVQKQRLEAGFDFGSGVSGTSAAASCYPHEKQPER